MKHFMMMLVAVLALSSAASGEWMMYCDDGDSSAFYGANELALGTWFKLSDFGLSSPFTFDHLYIMFKSYGVYLVRIHHGGSSYPGDMIAQVYGNAIPNIWQYVSLPSVTVGNIFWVVVQDNPSDPVLVGLDYTGGSYHSYYYDGWDWVPTEYGRNYGIKIEYSVALDRTSWAGIKASF
jgi:hypothetical protein